MAACRRPIDTAGAPRDVRMTSAPAEDARGERAGAATSRSWQLAPISALPTKTLDAWFVVEVPLHGPTHPWTCFLMGWRREGGTGQVSAPVAAVDPVTRRVATTEGCVYVLAGHAGLNSDAFVLWRQFRERSGISNERDVTAEVEALLDELS